MAHLHGNLSQNLVKYVLLIILPKVNYAIDFGTQGIIIWKRRNNNFGTERDTMFL